MGCHRVGKGCRHDASEEAVKASFQHFGADVEPNVAAGREKTSRDDQYQGVKDFAFDDVM